MGSNYSNINMNTLPPHPYVKKHIEKGMDFSLELLDAIDTISKKYKEHIGYSIEIGNFNLVDKSLMYACRNLVAYHKKYKDLNTKYEEMLLKNCEHIL